jgi:hypothetical protein
MYMMFFSVNDFLTGDSGKFGKGISFFDNEWLLAVVLTLSSGSR